MKPSEIRNRLLAVLDREPLMSGDRERAARYGVNAVMPEILKIITEEGREAVRKTKEEAENYEGL